MLAGEICQLADFFGRLYGHSVQPLFFSVQPYFFSVGLDGISGLLAGEIRKFADFSGRLAAAKNQLFGSISELAPGIYLPFGITIQMTIYFISNYPNQGIVFFQGLSIFTHYLSAAYPLNPMTEPENSQPAKLKELKCKHCSEKLHRRIHRPVWVKLFLFWLPLKRYVCLKCFKKTYRLQ
jgi:hypothetical protein